MGDAVKASTGYAFQFIQKQTQQIVNQLKSNQALNPAVHHTRHQFYDAVLLYILEHQKMAGDEIFARIFKKNTAATVFKFLSNTSTLLDDIKIMSSLPTPIFLPAAVKVLFRRG
jgi:lycopene beta-cyclase